AELEKNVLAAEHRLAVLDNKDNLTDDEAREYRELKTSQVNRQSLVQYIQNNKQQLFADQAKLDGLQAELKRVETNIIYLEEIEPEWRKSYKEAKQKLNALHLELLDPEATLLPTLQDEYKKTYNECMKFENRLFCAKLLPERDLKHRFDEVYRE